LKVFDAPETDAEREVKVFPPLPATLVVTPLDVTPTEPSEATFNVGNDLVCGPVIVALAEIVAVIPKLIGTVTGEDVTVADKGRDPEVTKIVVSTAPFLLLVFLTMNAL
jgi:hypothetical protein